MDYYWLIKILHEFLNNKFSDNWGNKNKFITNDTEIIYIIKEIEYIIKSVFFFFFFFFFFLFFFFFFFLEKVRSFNFEEGAIIYTN